MHTRTDLMNFMTGVTASRLPRFKAAMERMKETAKPEEQKQEEAWNRLKRDIASSAQTIHDIDTGNRPFMILTPEKQEDTAVHCSSAVSLIR